MKIRPVGTELFREDRQTYRQMDRHYGANNPLFAILRTHRKLNNILQGRNCCLFGLSFKTHKACGQDADFCNVKADVPCSNSQLLFLLITNLTHFFQCIYLFPLSTCFEQPSAHHQENQIVPIHHLVYITLCR